MESVFLFVGLMLIPCIAFAVVNFTLSKIIEVNIKSKLSGFEVARKILDDNGLDNMYIVEVKGNYNDHYDYNQKVIRLSTDIFHEENVVSAIIAARECAHAIQDKNNYTFFKIKSILMPLFNFSIYLSYVICIIALFIQDFGMVRLAAFVLESVLIFNIITLPVEYNANKIILDKIKTEKILEKDELLYAQKVLKVIPYISIMNILTSISRLFSEIMYNLQRK